MADMPQDSFALDTTPNSRKPAQERVDAAEREIQRILEDTHPRQDGKIAFRADSLCKKLRDLGHTLAVAQWAIHQSIEAGRLVVELVEWGGVIHVPSASPMRFGTPSLTAGAELAISASVMPGSTGGKRRKGNFENFCVVATKLLWEWNNTKKCVECGSILIGKDKDREVCFDCRKPDGKVTELWVELNMVNGSGNPGRIKQWETILSWMEEQFGDQLSWKELWEKTARRIKKRKKCTADDLLRMQLDEVVDLLESGKLNNKNLDEKFLAQKSFGYKNFCDNKENVQISDLLRELIVRLNRVGQPTLKVEPWSDILDLTTQISQYCLQRWNRKSIQLDQYSKSPFGETLFYHAWDPITSDSQMGAIPITEKFADIRLKTFPVFLDFVGRWERFARLNENEPRTSTAEQEQAPHGNVTQKRTAKGGRNKAKMSKEEKRIWDAWKTGKYKNYNDLDEAEHLAWGTVKATLKRLRARARRNLRTTKPTND
jgi:hypothetical protein